MLILDADQLQLTTMGLKNTQQILEIMFLGCNVNLVAPLKVSDNVFIAAGSTVTKIFQKVLCNCKKQTN